MPDMSLRPGEIFAGYTVERELGSGGMGAVYLVTHPRLPRFDALKLLRQELCADPAFVGRFEREADMVAQLDHPNIVSVHDRGSQDGQLWISMRFIDGTNAEKALTVYPLGMPPERAVRIVGKVASALDYAHKRQLLHRDVKPANILLTAGDEDDDDLERVFLTDFGVSKAIGDAADRISSMTSTGSIVATLDYASPEQIRGEVLDQRTDIYALGCVLYKLLTGSVPFPGDSVATRVYGHLNNEARPPSVLAPTLPSGFDEVTRRAMAKDPDERYPSCRALAAAAVAALTSPVSGPAPVRQPGDGPDTVLTTARRPNDRALPPQPLPPWLGSTPPGTRPERFGPDAGRPLDAGAYGRPPHAGGYRAQEPGGYGYPLAGPYSGPGNTGPHGASGPRQPTAAQRPGGAAGHDATGVPRSRRTAVIVAAVVVALLVAAAVVVLVVRYGSSGTAAGSRPAQSSSTMVALACPPPSHMVCSP